MVDVVRRFNRGQSARNSLRPATFKRGRGGEGGTQFQTTSRIIYLHLTTIKEFITSKQTEATPDSSTPGFVLTERNPPAISALRLRAFFVALNQTAIRRTLYDINACMKTRREKRCAAKRVKIEIRIKALPVMADIGESSVV